MTEFKIEKDVPVPPKAAPGRRRAYLRWPFNRMDVGSSVFLSDDGFRSALCHYGRRTGKEFVTRAVDGGWRVWRVE